MRNSFGGYCDSRKAKQEAFGSGDTINPWKDGGCVPEAPESVSATAAGNGKLTVSWQDVDNDGGSPIKGYKVQWKSGTQSYSSSRRATVTDLTDLQHTISGLTGGLSHTIRVVAYNHNGNGAAAETAATPTSNDTDAPGLFTARTATNSSQVLLTYDEELSESSVPATSAFSVNVSGTSSSPSSISIQGKVVTLSVAGIDSPTDTVTVGYTVPSGVEAMPLKDSAGNNAPDFSNEAVRNDRTSVAFTSDPGTDNTYAWNNGKDRDVIEVTVTFSEPVEVRGVPKVNLQVGDLTRGANYRSGSGTTSLVFSYGVSDGDADADGVSVMEGSVSGMVRYASSSAVAPAPVSFHQSSDHLVDAVRPALVSIGMLAGQDDMVMTWSRALDESSVPIISDEAFYVWDYTDKERLEISAIAIQGNQLILTMSSSVNTANRVIVSYRRPSPMRPLKDTIGNYAVETIAYPVSFAQNANSAAEFPATEDGIRSVDENTPTGENIGSPVAATDADNDSLTYAISGTDAAYFDVVSTSGQLRTRDALDHESRDSYSFTMSVTDNKDTFGNRDTTTDDTITVTVTVNDVDEGPTVSGETDLSVDENTETFSRTYTASDPEGAASTYIWSLSGTDGGVFSIDTNTGELTFASPPDYESPADSNRDNEYLVTVVATGQDSLKGELAVTVTVNGVNEAPTISGSESPSFNESTSFTTTVARYSATDPEGDSFAWSLGGADASSFNIDTSGNLKFSSQPDREEKNQYSVTIVATDDADPPNRGELPVTVTVTDVDEPPVITGTSTIDDYDENGTASVATYTASDPEGDTDLSWSLAGTDRGDFDITGGVLTFKNPPDFERPADSGGNNHYEVTVQATDNTNKRGELHVDLVVKNVDEPPVISGPDTVDEFPENSATSRQVGRYSASDPEGATVTLSLAGTDSDDFSLASNGVLTFNETPDYEEQSSYSVTVRAAAGLHTLNRVVTVSILNVEEAGTVTLSAVQPQEDTQITATLEDDDVPTGTTWQWYRTSSRSGSGTAITNATSRSYTPVFDDIGRYLRVVASYDDGYSDGKSAAAASANRVQEAPPVPEPPVFPPNGDYARSVRENLRTGTNVGRPVTATDGNNDRLTYSIGASDYFEIIGATGQLRTTAELDRENREQHTVTVTATDPGGLTDSVSVTVTVEDVDEQPEVDGPNSLEFVEGTSNGTTLATYTSTDPDRTGIDLVLSGTDSEDFTLSGGGILTFNEVPNFEAPDDSNRDNRYQFTVEAREQGDGTSVGRLNVTIRVTNVDEPGSLEANVAEPRVGQTMRLRVEDEDGGVSVREWKWERGDATGSCNSVTTWETISSARSSSYTASAADQDHCIRVTAIYNDRAGKGRTEQFITSGTVETGPFFTQDPPTYRVQEATVEGRSIGRVQARHSHSGEALTYSLSGADARFFTIDNSGQLRTGTNPLDYESRTDIDAVVIITAEDDNGRTASITVTITVTEVNEGPEISRIGSAPGSVPENYDPSLVLARYTATDPEDPTAQITRWSTSGTDGGDFVINEQGELRFRYTPDYERPADGNRDNVYTFTVRASDGRVYGSFDETITVTPVNEAPTITTTSTSATSLRQNENQTSRLYTYRATDPEGSAVTWSVAGTDARYFAIDERGQFSFKEDSPPDFEQPGDSGADNVYEVTIQARDDASNVSSLPVTVTVREVNEGPEVTGGRSSFTIDENQELPSAVYTATDPEGGAVTRWAVGGTDGGDFTITQEGVLTFRNLPDYERPADGNRDNIYELQVRPYDGRYYGSFDVTVTVNDVNEPPTITTTSSSATALRQNENQTSRLYTYRATDPEGSTVTWSVAGTDARYFAIDERGQFSFKGDSPPDFEQPGDLGRDNVYDVTIRAQDDGGNTVSLPVTVTVRETAEGPVVSGGQSSFTIDENRDLPSAVYSATDPEGSVITRWSLGGSDGGDFTITQQGVLTFRSLPDYERPADSNRDNVYELQVRPYDGRYYGSFDVTVTVNDVNEPPTITTTGTSATSLRQRENLTNRLYTYRATDPEGSTVAWSVAGTDNRFFTIDEQGQFSFREDSLPDFEQPGDQGSDNVYEVTIQARDDGGNTGSVPVTVTVSNDAEGVEPVISTRYPPSTYRENNASAVYTFSASDPQRQDITWSLEGADRGDFTLTEDSGGRGVLAFSGPPDYEDPVDADRQNDYELTVVATDEDGNADRLSFTVTVTDVNEGPEVSGPSGFTIAENARLSNAVYTATDPEGSHIARWSVGGRDGGDFFITQGGTLYFRTLPDYDRPADSDRDNVYEVTIQPSDGRVLGSYPVTVTVTDVNEPPEIRHGSATTFTQQENRTSRLYTFSATDPEGSDVSWSVGGTDGRLFAIDERGQFSFREDSPPDFDTPADDDEDNVYRVAVQASDPESNSASLAVIVTVTEVNEGPGISRQGSAPGSVPENHGTDRVLARYTASDPERPSVTITQWSTSGTDGGDFTINALGELRFRNSPDYERPADGNRDNVYEVTIRASDGRNTGTLEEIQVVTVTDVNEPPTITTTSRTAFTQQENRTSVLYTFRASDPEGSTVTWTAAGTDGSHFNIDDQGQFSFREDSPPDFDSPGDSDRDNVYAVTVRASDDASNSASLSVTVTVTDHNESVEPTISTRRPPTTYRENGTSAVYTFSASDPQPGTTITWSLTGTDAGDFTITTDSSGRGMLAFVVPPDFESPADADHDNTYELAVVATDDDGNSDRVDFTITVTNHNEGVEPTISTRRPPSTYRENSTSALYTFSASDPQPGTTITWSVTGTDAADFTITRDTSGRGVLTFSSPPDFESPADADRDNTYELAVVASDGDGNSDRVALTITVTDVNEPPVVTLNGTATTAVPENTADTQVLARFSARDPENPTAGIFRWSTTGRDAGDFVVSALGELRFRSAPDFERPADSDRDNAYEVTVRASDGSYYGMPEDQLTITVTQVNEPPVITTKSRTEFSLRENSTSTIYTYRATDQDSGDTIGWSVEGADGGDFAIHNGILTFRLLPDLENPADADEDNIYEITVVASDSAGLRDTVDASITITDQSEGPVIAGRTSYTVAENYDITQALGSYTATDARDGRAVHPQWSLSGRDGGDFTIDKASGALTFRNTPDYDRPADSDRDNVYELTVRGHDSRAYGDLSVTVTVTGINEHAPVISGSNTHTVRENTESAFYTFRATDADLNDTITWSVEGTDGEDFTIDSGALSFGSIPDYENPVDSDSNNVYALTVVATDSGGLRGTFALVVNVTELNEGPAVSGTASFTVNENNDLANASYTATDPEATAGVTTTITWSVSGRDGGDFTVDRETGALTFRTLPDYERPADHNRDNEYEVTVRAYDGRSYGTFDVTVAVLDVAEITGPTSLDRAENFTGVLATFSAAGQGALDVTPAWRLTGTDGGDFSIDEQGQLTFRYAPDHERPADGNRDNMYEFTVQVSDGSYHDTQDITVTVTAVNEPPAITGRDSLSFRENTPVTTRLQTYSATDPEGEDFTWQLGGLDAGDFTITADSSGRGILTFAASPNFDSPAGSGTHGNEYLVTVQARDSQGNTGQLPVTVTVTDQNEGATVSGRTEIAVVENRDPALVLATYSATDPEGQAITRWSLGGSDAGDFSISEDGELTFRSTPDYDRPADGNRDNEYLVTVRAYDGSTYGNLDVTVTVSNVNEHDPVIRSGSRTSFSYREEGASTLYTYSATDGDKDDLITWTASGTDGSLFEFDDENALQFKEPPDFEDPHDSGRDNVYELAVVATDSGGRSASLDVTVTVTAVDEGPEISGTATYTVAEGQELVGATFSATDPENPSIEVTNWRTSGTDGGDFAMSQDGVLSFRSTPDFERPADSNRDNVYEFTVQVSDGRNYGSLDVTVTVTDLNEADPEVSGSATLSVRENTMSTLYTYSARDMDRDTKITWSVRGTDSDDLTITEDDSGRGMLTFSSGPDHEQPSDSNSDNVYEITVVASDGTNEGTLDVTITVTNVNEGPEISGRDTLTVSENDESVLATYSAIDPEDTGAEITRWSVTGRDGGDFTIDEDGDLTFRSPPDYERPADSDRDNVYEVTVRASDGQVYGTYDVSVTVQAVDEAPVFQSGSRDSFSYRENGTSTLYTYRATDPEGADVSWSLGGTDGGDFAITTDSSGRGVLSLEEPPDYDDPADDDQDNVYEVTVVATDQTGHAANLPVTVTVTDVNEGPAVSGSAEYTVRENHDAALGTYTARDPEDPTLEITRWSVSGSDGGDFKIDEDGELSFRHPPDYERPADGNRDNVYEVTVRASDGSYYGSFDVTVTVEAVNEPPDITGDVEITYRENDAKALETYRATDPEKTDITWGLSGLDAGAFSISETGVLTFRNAPDYEDPADDDDDNVYEVTVEATDEDAVTGRQEVTVTVTNLTD